jgi:hypothetical protein
MDVLHPPWLVDVHVIICLVKIVFPVIPGAVCTLTFRVRYIAEHSPDTFRMVVIG